MGDFLWYVKIPKYKIIDKSKAIRNKIWNAKITWGQTVIHKKFGEGIILKFDKAKTKIKVRFQFGEKDFIISPKDEFNAFKRAFLKVKK